MNWEIYLNKFSRIQQRERDKDMKKYKRDRKRTRSSTELGTLWPVFQIQLATCF